jgi:Calcineurin-like phosphoesterase/Arc-like DNA binding domain
MVASNVKAASTSDKSVAFASNGNVQNKVSGRVFDGAIAKSGEKPVLSNKTWTFMDDLCRPVTITADLFKRNTLLGLGREYYIKDKNGKEIVLSSLTAGKTRVDNNELGALKAAYDKGLLKSNQVQIGSAVELSNRLVKHNARPIVFSFSPSVVTSIYDKETARKQAMGRALLQLGMASKTVKGEIQISIPNTAAGGAVWAKAEGILNAIPATFFGTGGYSFPANGGYPSVQKGGFEFKSSSAFISARNKERQNIANGHWGELGSVAQEVLFSMGRSPVKVGGKTVRNPSSVARTEMARDYRNKIAAGADPLVRTIGGVRSPGYTAPSITAPAKNAGKPNTPPPISVPGGAKPDAKGAGGTAGTTRANERNRQLGAKQPAMTVTQDDPNYELGGAVKDKPKMRKGDEKPALTRKYFVNSEGNFQFQTSGLKIIVQKPPQSSLKHHPMTVATPEHNTAIAVTTDFHGMHIRAKNMLDGLIRELRQSPEAIKILVVNGDLINKGPDSANVLANLRETIKKNPDIRFKLITGNHEREYGGPIFLRGNVPVDDTYMEHIRDLLIPQGGDREGKGLALTASSYAKKYGKGESEFGRRLRNPPDIKDLKKKLARAEGRGVNSEIYAATQHVEEARRWYQSFQDTMMRLVPKGDILLIKNMREKYQNGNIFIAHTLDAGKNPLTQTGSDLRLPRFVVQMQNYEAAGEFNRDFGGFYPIVGHTMVEKPIITFDQGAAIDHASFRRNRLAGLVITPNSVRIAFSGMRGFRSETLEQAMEYGDIVNSYRKTKVIPNR